MTLSQPDETVLKQSLMAVVAAALDLTTARDTDAIRSTLTAIRDRVLDAGDTLNRAEEEARAKALEAYQ